MGTSSNKGNLPELIFIAPIGAPRHKIRHAHVLFVVEEWDGNGLPLRCRLANDEEVYNVEAFTASGGEFMTAYIQERMLEVHSDKVNKVMKDRDAGRKKK